MKIETGRSGDPTREDTAETHTAEAGTAGDTIPGPHSTPRRSRSGLFE